MPENIKKTSVDRFCFRTRENPGLVASFSRTIFPPGVEIVCLEKGGLGYEKRLQVTHGGDLVLTAFYGGDHQKNTQYVDITGKGCGLIKWDDPLVQRLIDEYIPGTILKRIDIALDFYHGEVTHDCIKRAYQDDGFTNYRNKPRCNYVGPTFDDSDQGRTIYIGTRGKGLFLRCYEKGKKEYRSENNPLPNWYRIELELRPAKTPILPPSYYIQNRDNFFAGSYPFLGQLLPNVIPEKSRKGKDDGLELMQLLEQIQKQYGPTLKTAIDILGVDTVLQAVVDPTRDNLKLRKKFEAIKDNSEAPF